MGFKSILKKLAPTVATAIGGPFGGIAANFAVKKLLPDANPADDSDALNMLESFISGADPTQLAQLKTIDNDFKLEMKRLGIKEEELAVRDRDSAREMATKKGMMPQVILSVVYTLTYGVVMYCFMTGKINVPESQQVLFGALIGLLTGAQTQILNFWFGSSSGSKEKTSQLIHKGG